MADKVKVAVRVRPPNKREMDLDTKCVVEMSDNQTILHHPSGSLHGKKAKTFAFDHCFWSFDENDGHFADQATVYECLGTGVLDNAFKGYNACVFAYGQTGSGKSYTMMGTGPDRGVIPRLCDQIFQRISHLENASLAFKVEVTYMEIYNEKVRDLLDPSGEKHNLKVREHTILGPYVDGLSSLAVSSFEQIESLMMEGNKSRTVAATAMNSESSRSHAVFNLLLTQTLIDTESGTSGEKVSKISLVDLAGSERVQKTGAVGKRLEEGGNINKSLTTLGMVISALAEQSSQIAKGGKKFVPYRDSVLTWLLKDNLGGNSKTVMVATISPAADNYEESLSALRYADRAKRIEQHAVVNEDPNAKIIRELRAELEALRDQLKEANQASDLKERLAESEKLMAEMSRTWEEKLKETETKQLERHTTLEKMGISVEASGIKVEHGNFYLVNLNADPSLNELLVYYIKGRTIVGCVDTDGGGNQPDIQLQGLGVQPEHCVFTLEENKLMLEPLEGAKTFLNGAVMVSKTQMRNGYRVLIGNNHFFKVNCPKELGGGAMEDSMISSFDYDEALKEVIHGEIGENPISSAVAALEKQYKEKLEREAEEEKNLALDRQRREYEKQLSQLRSIISPMTPGTMDPFGLRSAGGLGGTPLTPWGPSFPFPNPRSDVQSKFVEWSHERDDQFKKSLSRLKADIVKANALVREANLLAADMNKYTAYSVTLQIPAANLRPSKIKQGAFVSEPAILVKRRSKGSQVWSMDKLEYKLIDMRELFHEWQNCLGKEKKSEMLAGSFDPFFESQENHNLIGVSNVFLEVLFHNVHLDYHVPIISQQGEVAGRLHVEVYRVNAERIASAGDTNSGDDSSSNDGAPIRDANGNHSVNSNNNPMTDSQLTTSSVASGEQQVSEDGFVGRTITCRVRIKQASSLPSSLSHFVFCQYSFWGQTEPIVVPPSFEPTPTTDTHNDSMTAEHAHGTCNFNFDHEKDFTVMVTDEFLEFVQEDALSIEVWGHRSGSGHLSGLPHIEQETLQKTKSLQERWSEVTRRLKLHVAISELNESGMHQSVEVQRCSDVLTGGVFQLKQGMQKRIEVQVSDSADKGSLPLVCQHVSSIAVGCICTRNRTVQKPLDSYQEIDLDAIKDKWREALQERRVYLDEQIQRLMGRPDKAEEDVEREMALISQWVALTEERNAVAFPAADSNIPGALAHLTPPPGLEKHIPVLFLNINADGMSQSVMSGHSSEDFAMAGVHSILPKEHTGKMFNLPIVKHDDASLTAAASWDSSIHEHPALNRMTPAHERVYAILKVVVRLSHPAEIDIVLRKRLCINVYKKTGLAERFIKRLVGPESVSGCGVFYDVVAHIPKSSYDVEDRSTLALMAGRPENENGSGDGESYIEKYTKGISAVESILALDRLRQEVTIRELLNRQEAQLTGTLGPSNRNFRMKRTASLPTAISPPFGSGLLRQSTIMESSEPRLSSHQLFVSPAGGKKPPLVTVSSPGGQSSSAVAKMQKSPLGVLDEEQTTIRKEDEDSVVRSATVPEHLIHHSNRDPVRIETQSGTVTGPKPQTTVASSSSSSPNKRPPLTTATGADASVSSSGYGSQVLSTKSEESVESLLAANPSSNPAPSASTPLSTPSPCDTLIPQKTARDINDSLASAMLADSGTMSKSLSSMDGSDFGLEKSTCSDYGVRLMSESTNSTSTERALSGTNSTSTEDNNSSTIPRWLTVGNSVCVLEDRLRGIVRYVGPRESPHEGVWVGVELRITRGENDGTVNGVQYFRCQENHGLFLKMDEVYPL